MDLESADGSRIPLERGSSMEIGRGLGLGFGPISSDPTVSRRHLTLRLPNDAGSKVLFEVIGRNPVVVCSSRGSKRVYRRSEKGELEEGDRISLSLKNPSFFVLKARRGKEPAAMEADEGVLDAVERRERRKGTNKEMEEEEFGGEEDSKEAFARELEEELESLDVSQIDPIQEFGFLVRGHEFDQYSRKKIRPAKDWNWFLDETKEESDGDDDDDEVFVEATGSKRKGRRRRRKKSGGGDEDEEWTGGSADEKDLVTSGGSAKRPKYTTRSKGPKKPRNGASFGSKPAPKKDVKSGKDELDEEDEGDETLGGFIVDEEEVDEEEEEDEEEELEDEEESD